MHYDVFNGDADGLCAIHQLRLARAASRQPHGQHYHPSQLISGVKRDIALLQQVPVDGTTSVCVCDIALHVNRVALMPLLDAGIAVSYYDHHTAGDIPDHPKFSAHIHTAAQTCTGLIVNGVLQEQYADWAAVAAFGDNFDSSAKAVLNRHSLTEQQIQALKMLGIVLNYNSYGITIPDLWFAPTQVLEAMQPYQRALDFQQDSPIYSALVEGYQEDILKAQHIGAESITSGLRIYRLPDAAWARRISGTFSNQLANAAPDYAHIVAVPASSEQMYISVRAAKNHPYGADIFCQRFPNSGGRAAAAGINHFPIGEWDALVRTACQYFDTAIGTPA